MNTTAEILNRLDQLQRDVRNLSNKFNTLVRTGESEWISRKEAAEIAGVGAQHITNLCSIGKIKSRKHGKLRINRASLMAYIK